MYQYNNPHPKGKLVGDCVKRAIALATGKDYLEIQRDLNKLKKLTGCDTFNSNKNYKHYIEKVLNCKKLSFPAIAGEPRMDGYSFCIKFPKGKYI